MKLASSPRLSLAFALSLTSAVAVSACGGTPAMPGGAGKLADKTFAGQNRCNPKSHDRPFIIEWDATDQSSFQSYAASDVVVVKYEGCEMKVLDGCREDNAKGKNGTYNPVQWTSGGVETIDIHDEGELYAKLPLGAATLNGKVQSGEKLHMEYYVSGTRTATRDALYRADLDKNPKCAGATHFVYAYNLGAFAIAAQSNLKGEVHGSYLGFGAGGSKANETKTEKKGGELGACKGESAKEVESCKVPVRLTLREITAGSDPASAGLKGEQSDKSLNATGLLKAETDAQKKGLALYESAQQKMESGDGKGCLQDLDLHDQLDPRPGGLSTLGSSIVPAMTRAKCLMLTGQCGPGRDLIRKAWEARDPSSTAEHTDGIVTAELTKYCRGGGDDKTKYAAARGVLTMGGNGVKRHTVAECQGAFDTMMALRTKITKADDASVPDKPLVAFGMLGPACFAKAGDCGAAYKAFKALNDAKAPGEERRTPGRRGNPDRVTHGPSPDGFKYYTEEETRKGFETLIEDCKGK
ncbi:MAG: hypothetical protein IPK71_16710 [Myxococcales bacterium]|nr:hypothetical protein [Myxococcales bacterium]